jgi:pyruvate formate lyase activating enzyme
METQIRFKSPFSQLIQTLIEASLYKRLDGDVECQVCFRRCRIRRGGLGFCYVRKNVDGKLYSLNYGRLIAENLDPIEKKPLFHFYPGSTAYSIATVGCNYRCCFCCNSDISQSKEISGRDRTPEQVVRDAAKLGATSISYTYTEPTMNIEFVAETAKLAHKKGMKNTMVTNGSMTAEALDFVHPHLDAATVDLKGNGNKQFYLQKMGVPSTDHIFQTLKGMKEKGVHVEVTDLIVPKYGESTQDLIKLVGWVRDELGPFVPFHLLRFFPSYKMFDVPATPLKLIEEGLEIAKKEGLRYVYAGNVPGHKTESTYCHNCGKLLISRHGMFVDAVNLTEDNSCPDCGTAIPIVGNPTVSSASILY